MTTQIRAIELETGGTTARPAGLRASALRRLGRDPFSTGTVPSGGMVFSSPSLSAAGTPTARWPRVRSARTGSNLR